MLEESSANEEEWSESEAAAEVPESGAEVLTPPPLPESQAEEGTVVISPAASEGEPTEGPEGGAVVITPAASEGEEAPEPEVPSPFEEVEVEGVAEPAAEAVVATSAEVVSGGTAPAPKAPGPPEGKKKDNTLLIVIIVVAVLLLLCCCCIVGGVIVAGLLKETGQSIGALLSAVNGLI